MRRGRGRRGGDEENVEGRKREGGSEEGRNEEKYTRPRELPSATCEDQTMSNELTGFSAFCVPFKLSRFIVFVIVSLSVYFCVR